MSCALLVAHLALHSGIHSILLFCSIPLGLVQSYKHLPKHPSNSGSFLVPLIAGSTSLAYAACGGCTTCVNNIIEDEERRKVCRNVPRLTMAVGDDVEAVVVEEEIMEDEWADVGNVVNRGVTLIVWWNDVVFFLLGVVE